jgi:hypothetical protein
MQCAPTPSPSRALAENHEQVPKAEFGSARSGLRRRKMIWLSFQMFENVAFRFFPASLPDSGLVGPVESSYLNVRVCKLISLTYAGFH